MAEFSYPTIGGGSVTDARYEQIIGSLTASGLVGTPALSDLVYADSSGRQVKVQPSRAAMLRGFRWESDGAGIVRSIAANGSSNPRIDLAVLRLNRSDWTVTFQIVQGASSASPVAPSPTQNTGSTGVWELPLAHVTVPAAASTLAAGAVKSIGWYIGGPSMSGKSLAFPPVTPGATFTAVDTGKVYGAFGSVWHLTGENGSLVSTGAATGWGDPNIYFRRRNGDTYMQAQVQRTGATLPAAQSSILFTIPLAYRPLHNIGILAYAGGNIMHCHIDASSGTVTLADKGINFSPGAYLITHPVNYASN